jgi:hypothetical protein
MALELHVLELDIWTTTTTNLNNTTKILKHMMLPLLHLKLLVKDELWYALHFLRSWTKQKEKRKNLRHKKRSRLTHL